VTSASAAEIRALKRKCRELEETIEVLKAATAFFARACDPLTDPSDGDGAAGSDSTTTEASDR
jgi:transposase-like protein